MNLNVINIHIFQVMLDTHFLSNMEEHLPDHIAIQHWKYKHQDRVKYIGRGAIYVKGKAYYEWLNNHLRAIQRKEKNKVTKKSLIDVVSKSLS